MIMDKAAMVEKILLAIISSGLKYDLIGPHTELRSYPETGIIRDLCKTHWNGEIGLKLKRSSNVWHWFKFQFTEDFPFLSFTHSYSQANGKTKGSRGWKHAHRIRESLLKIIGIDPHFYWHP